MNDINMRTIVDMVGNASPKELSKVAVSVMRDNKPNSFSLFSAILAAGQPMHDDRLLEYAVQSDDARYLCALLDAGVPVNARVSSLDNSLLHEASGRWVPLLLQRGADINAVNNFGQRPLHTFCSRTRESIMKVAAIEALMRSTTRGEPLCTAFLVTNLP